MRPNPDMRGAREADATRDPTNYKPYRTKAQRIEARRLARRDSDGTMRSSAPSNFRTRPPAGATRKEDDDA